MNSDRRYRPNIAIIVVNDSGRVLACRRADTHQAWQLPQGGIEPGESLFEAMERELLEEIGTKDVEVLGFLPFSIRYDWPEKVFVKGFIGQEQSYALVRIRPSARIDLFQQQKNEFDLFEWLEVTEFLGRLSGFKADAYRQALDALVEEFPTAFLKDT